MSEAMMGSLHKCLKDGRYKQFHYLLKLNADVNELDERLHTPLIRICYTINDMKMAVHLIKTLLHKGAKIDVEDEEGLSLLHIACKDSKPDLVRLLLSIVPDSVINSKDAYGNAPLHYAASHQSPQILNQILPQLIKYHMNIDERNKLGFTPLLIAASNGRLEVARTLLATGHVSLTVIDSLYFKSTEEWLRMYYNWPLTQDIFNEDTKYSSKNRENIHEEKLHLQPIQTTPPVNELLQNFSRQHSAFQLQEQNKRRIVPKIVITRVSGKQPNTAVLQSKSCPSTPRNSTKPGKSGKPGLCTGRSVQVIRRPMTSGYKLTSGYIGHKVVRKKQNQSSRLPLLDDGTTTIGSQENYWNSLITSFTDISSEQLSRSYRKTVVPKWPANEQMEDVEAGHKAAAIIMGVLGKVRKGHNLEESSGDEATPRQRVKEKLLKVGKKAAALGSIETAGAN